MKSLLIAASAVATLAPVAIPAPALARDYRDEIRNERRECNRELRRSDSRREFDRELRECRREISREQREYRHDNGLHNGYAWGHRNRYRGTNGYDRAYGYDGYGYNSGYTYSGAPYYADRYYRDGSYYADRRLSRYDRVYRGYDGRYYCRRDDGTTGLIIGAGLGALLGNSVDVGGSRTLNTILGGAAGAAIGHAIDKGSARCD